MAILKFMVTALLEHIVCLVEEQFGEFEIWRVMHNFFQLCSIHLTNVH